MQEYNDYELVALAKENNEEAINIIYQKYQPLIYKKARYIYNIIGSKGIELSDIIQEGMIGLEEAINRYNEKDNTLFYTFANLCINRKMRTLISKVNRDKHKILNEAVSYDTNDDEEISLLNYIYDKTDNPEYGLISEEEEEELYQKIKSQISDFESTVFDLKIQGFTYKEIASILDKDPKTIDNALSRLKTKIKNILKEED